MNDDFVNAFYRKLLRKGRVQKDRKKENLRRKEKKLSDQLDNTDLVLGIHQSYNNLNDVNTTLRNLISVRGATLFPLSSSIKEKMEKRIEVLKHVVRASIEEVRFNSNCLRSDYDCSKKNKIAPK